MILVLAHRSRFREILEEGEDRATGTIEEKRQSGVGQRPLVSFPRGSQHPSLHVPQLAGQQPDLLLTLDRRRPNRCTIVQTRIRIQWRICNLSRAIITNRYPVDLSPGSEMFVYPTMHRSHVILPDARRPGRGSPLALAAPSVRQSTNHQHGGQAVVGLHPIPIPGVARHHRHRLASVHLSQPQRVPSLPLALVRAEF